MIRVLLSVGLLLVTFAVFPLGVSPWLSREVQWLAGVITLLTGLVLGEIERIVGRK